MPHKIITLDILDNMIEEVEYIKLKTYIRPKEEK